MVDVLPGYCLGDCKYVRFASKEPKREKNKKNTTSLPPEMTINKM
jgi:hypothetical protein